MPEHLKQYFQQLTAKQAEELWDWLDGDPDAIHKMLEDVASNPNLLRHERTPLGGN